MTREKIISGLKFTIGMFLFDPNTGETLTEPRNDMDKTTIDACKGAIELLEQEPVLDKIRAEIDEQYKWLIDTRHTICDVDIAFDSIFRFIDKYKAESEDKE